MKLWYSRQLRELSTQELVKVINGELNDVPVDHEIPDMTAVDLSTGNEATLTLLDAFRSFSVPVRVSPDNDDPEIVRNAVTVEERSHITKSEARKIAHSPRCPERREGDHSP